ncbi:bifunctional adenosylcobinamide kinase/adenosylcobinamide-phosphate guanylyltransferase [Lentibacillus saliphilus]|uniref:bifunctional adenosylcobinamide kinase/adenosylcobinamide-phosphate guanylyltransferase n=1 Tax=Lentibacillus saliphilus TaxID=2737028 RepID=UPI001C2F71A0|nr:bifunctional adenosylcobinamide kinase/adenosylcobinamide-phosphate guanylyltransferase [Lentibacillus saliphilus]
MHVVTGGAYNGKTAWIKNHYMLESRVHQWISAHDGGSYLLEQHISDFIDLIVLSDVEQWVWQWVQRGETDRQYGQDVLQRWLDWEKAEPNRVVIVIGADISKGIVPMEKADRQWRDLTGWFYQDLVEASERFDLIWYGVSKRLK